LNINKTATATATAAALKIAIKRNGDIIFYKNYAPTLTAVNTLVSVEVDSRMIELTAGDEIEIYLTFECTIASSEAWAITIMLTTTTIYKNSVTRWYGEGSTVEISSILPDQTAREFIKFIVDTFNLKVYTDVRTQTVTLKAGEILNDIHTVDCWEVEEELENNYNTELKFISDMNTLVDENELISVDSAETKEVTIPISRQFFGSCYRLFNNTSTLIPVCWKDGNPEIWNAFYPVSNSKMKARILKYIGQISQSYTLTYGGSTSTNSVTRTYIPAFQEIAIRQLFINDSLTERRYFECYAKLDILKLYNNAYFEGKIKLVDKYSNFVDIVRLVEAQQVSGDVFKLVCNSLNLE
jgi:hypothetical protein